MKPSTFPFPRSTWGKLPNYEPELLRPKSNWAQRFFKSLEVDSIRNILVRCRQGLPAGKSLLGRRPRRAVPPNGKGAQAPVFPIPVVRTFAWRLQMQRRLDSKRRTGGLVQRLYSQIPLAFCILKDGYKVLQNRRKSIPNVNAISRRCLEVPRKLLLPKYLVPSGILEVVRLDDPLASAGCVSKPF